jgi:hypothetical protein
MNSATSTSGELGSRGARGQGSSITDELEYQGKWQLAMANRYDKQRTDYYSGLGARKTVFNSVAII